MRNRSMSTRAKCIENRHDNLPTSYGDPWSATRGTRYTGCSTVMDAKDVQ